MLTQTQGNLEIKDPDINQKEMIPTPIINGRVNRCQCFPFQNNGIDINLNSLDITLGFIGSFRGDTLTYYFGISVIVSVELAEVYQIAIAENSCLRCSATF